MMLKSPQPFAVSVLLLSQLIPPQASVSAGEISDHGICNVIGRVLESDDPGISDNSALCAGGRIKVSPGKTVYLNCHKRSEYKHVFAGQHSVDRLCVVDRDAKSECLGKPCTRSGGQITLLSPRSSTVLTTPQLAWTPHKSAKSYEIFVGAFGEERFHGKTQGTSFDLAQHYSLTPGNIYRIDIYAATQNTTLEHAQFSLTIPSNEEMQEMNETIETVKSREMPELEKIQMIESAYYTLGLMDQSIEYLKSIRKDSSNALLVESLLADRLLESGYLLEAKVKYAYVNKHKKATNEEKKFAQKMIARIIALGF